MEKNEESRVVELYKKGYSIDYIINDFYHSKRKSTKVLNTYSKKIILIDCPIKKSECRGQVYKILYMNLKKRPPI